MQHAKVFLLTSNDLSLSSFLFKTWAVIDTYWFWLCKQAETLSLEVQLR
jgi:hypothetical protein